jgi:hypothetical protein
VDCLEEEAFFRYGVLRVAVGVRLFFLRPDSEEPVLVAFDSEPG